MHRRGSPALDVAHLGDTTVGADPELDELGAVADLSLGVGLRAAAQDDLLGTYERLKSDGVLPYWCINHGPTTSLYYADPDDNHVELQIDNYPDPAELQAWFKSGAFAANPIGVEFDPDVLVRRLAAGEPHEELVKQVSDDRTRTRTRTRTRIQDVLEAGIATE